MLGNVVLRRGEPAAGLLPAAGGVCVRVCGGGPFIPRGLSPRLPSAFVAFPEGGCQGLELERARQLAPCVPHPHSSRADLVAALLKALPSLPRLSSLETRNTRKFAASLRGGERDQLDQAENFVLFEHALASNCLTRKHLRFYRELGPWKKVVALGSLFFFLDLAFVTLCCTKCFLQII